MERPALRPLLAEPHCMVTYITITATWTTFCTFRRLDVVLCFLLDGDGLSYCVTMISYS